MFRLLKKKLKKIFILKGKHLKRFGLIGTKLCSDGSDTFEYCSFECYGANNIIDLKGNVNLTDSKIFISGKNNVLRVGKNSHISNAVFWIEGDGNLIDIGEGVYSNVNDNFTCIDGKKLAIGKGCLLSSDINFQVGDGHPIYDKDGKRTNYTEDVIIGNHVWIGKRAIILKGTEVAEGSVIGTGAIVKGKFTEGNVVIAGVPAKIIKKEIRWEKK